MGMVVSCGKCDKESEIEAWETSRKYKRVLHVKCPDCNEVHGAKMLHGENFLFYRVKII